MVVCRVLRGRASAGLERGATKPAWAGRSRQPGLLGCQQRFQRRSMRSALVSQIRTKHRSANLPRYSRPGSEVLPHGLGGEPAETPAVRRPVVSQRKPLEGRMRRSSPSRHRSKRRWKRCAMHDASVRSAAALLGHETDTPARSAARPSARGCACMPRRLERHARLKDRHRGTPLPRRAPLRA